MIELEELMPNGKQKSFGGKAKIVKSVGIDILCSYSKPVAMCIRDSNGHSKFIRLLDGYSSTTMRHINAFRETYGLEAISKKQWEKMPVNVDEVNLIEAV